MEELSSLVVLLLYSVLNYKASKPAMALSLRVTSVFFSHRSTGGSLAQ